VNVIRFNPFAEVTTLRDQVNRLFDEVATPRAAGRESNGPAPRLWAPLVNVVETEDAVTVTVDVPGVTRDAIDVQLTADTLTIRGERKWERAEGESLVHAERPYGSFQRSFTVGVPVQADRVSAAYRDGVLTVTLPKAEALKPRKVQIQALDEASAN
jgi:HSP20 family protein